MEYRTIYTLQVFFPDGGVITISNENYRYVLDICKRHCNPRRIIEVKQRKETSLVRVFNPFDNNRMKGTATSVTWVPVSRKVVLDIKH